ncbi:MAG: phosphosulfolactate synthase [Syntrophothermus sp.]
MHHPLLSFLPERPQKPRETGLTMMMDKGLSLREAEDFVSVAGHLTDYIKLGFGTSVMTPCAAEKVKIYRAADIKVYVGGTLFEAFIIRGKLDEYRKYIDSLGINAVEISDGSMLMDHDLKCEYIHKLSKDYTVLSEVGCKDAGIQFTPAQWTGMMKKELMAGSVKVIAEARESGNVGIYKSNGEAELSLICEILEGVSEQDIIWEAPAKSQQVWFIRKFGANVNLGNIAPNEVIPLETLRLGLRGDTFFRFLPESYLDQKPR